MRLAAAANAFNQTECLDAYTGTLAFLGQLGLYDDTKRDSETAERRVLSVAPDVEIPARRVIEMAGRRWIVGHDNVDTFRGSVLRQGLVVHEATALAEVQTLEQACLNQTGTRAWAGRAWVKDSGFSEQSSVLASVHHIHFSRTETVDVGQVVNFAGHYHVVRANSYGAAGMLVAVCEQLRGVVIEEATALAATFDPVTEAWTGSSSSFRAVRMRWQSLFEYRNNISPRFGPEDVQLAIAKASMTPRVGQKLTLSDGTWQIASVLDEGVWLCRAVRHA